MVETNFDANSRISRFGNEAFLALRSSCSHLIYIGSKATRATSLALLSVLFTAFIAARRGRLVVMLVFYY